MNRCAIRSPDYNLDRILDTSAFLCILVSRILTLYKYQSSRNTLSLVWYKTRYPYHGVVNRIDALPSSAQSQLSLLRVSLGNSKSSPKLSWLLADSKQAQLTLNVLDWLWANSADSKRAQLTLSYLGWLWSSSADFEWTRLSLSKLSWL